MFRRLCLLIPGLAVIASLLLVLPVAGGHPASQPVVVQPAAKADTWIPPSGAAFNQPRGGVKARNRLIQRVKAGINHAPKGSTIRFAMYSFDRRDIATALIKAHRRGVNVQMVVNDNWVSAQTRRLRNELGTKRKKKSFYVICRQSCRAGKGNLHLKVYSFSQTGAATKVLMTGSGNLTNRAAHLQWNDQVTLLNAPGLYDAFYRVFLELKRDKKASPRRINYSGDNLEAIFYRDRAASGAVDTTVLPRHPSPAQDPVLQRLRSVNCKAAPGYGVGGRTSIRIMMYAFMRNRGYLADRLAYMKRQGCEIQAITSVSSKHVIRKLKAAGIPLKSADYDFNPDAVDDEKRVNFYSHLKVMTLDGTYQGKSVRTVWTGSENWSRLSFANDELILHLTGDSVHAKYLKQFRLMWAKYTHKHGVRPQGPPR